MEWLCSGSAARRAPLLVPLLLSCLPVVPDLGPRPEPRAPNSLAGTFDAPSADWPADRWWESYGDPQLAHLDRRGLAGSPTWLWPRRASAGRGHCPAGRRGAAADDRRHAVGRRPPSSENPRPAGRPGLGRFWPDRARPALRPRPVGPQPRQFARGAVGSPMRPRHDAAEARLTLSTAIAASLCGSRALSALRDTAETNLRIRRTRCG